MNSATIVRSDFNSLPRERGPSRKTLSSGSGSAAWTCSEVPSGGGFELTALGYRAAGFQVSGFKFHVLRETWKLKPETHSCWPRADPSLPPSQELRRTGRSG